MPPLLIKRISFVELIWFKLSPSAVLHKPISRKISLKNFSLISDARGTPFAELLCTRWLIRAFSNRSNTCFIVDA